MGIIIDLILLAIIAFCGWRGFRGGIIRGVCGVVALIVSVYAANVVASAYSIEFTGMLKPFASGIVDTFVNEALSGGESDSTGGADADAEAGTENPADDTPIPGDALSLAKYVLGRVGLSPTAADRVSATIAEERESITAGLSARITDKLCAVLAYIAVFSVCFLLLAIVFAVIGNLINVVFSIPGLELIDSIAGAVFGVMKALILIFTLAIALRYIGVLTAETVEQTVALRFMVNINPVANILGI